MKRVIILFLAFSVASVEAATVNLTSCSWNEVNTAIGAAQPGDVFNFPSDNCSWSSAVQIKTPISVVGNGATLTASGNMPQGFFEITGFQADQLTRVTGFNFQMSTWSVVGALYVHHMVGGVAGGKIRIDHNNFYFGGEAIRYDHMKGLVDHNTFNNPIIGLTFSAGSRQNADDSWASLAAGTEDALFIEDNQFVTNENYKLGYTQEQVGTYNGGKLVVRHNSFTATDVSDDLETYTPFMAHGSADGGCGHIGYWELDPCPRRGQSVMEFYNNTEAGKRIDFMYTSRGSVNLVFNNTITTSVKYQPSIYLYEEEYWWDNSGDLRTAWPAEDQVHNTYLWNNKYLGNDLIGGIRGTAVTNGYGNCPAWSAPCTDGLQEGRDYFIHSPQGATDGKEIFTGLNGAADTYPTNAAGNGTMQFVPGVASAYSSYTPYQYPHPLNAGGTLPPASGGGGSSATGETKFNVFKNVFNPTKESLVINYSSDGNDLTLTIYDRTGNEVKVLDKGTAGQTTWDGRNKQGSVVASGSYVVILKQGSKVMKKRWLWLSRS